MVVKGFTFIDNFEARKARADLIYLMWLHVNQDAVIEKELTNGEIEEHIQLAEQGRYDEMVNRYDIRHGGDLLDVRDYFKRYYGPEAEKKIKEKIGEDKFIEYERLAREGKLDEIPEMIGYGTDSTAHPRGYFKRNSKSLKHNLN